ncbi:MAG: hypothetical protein ABJM43_14560 [Paracoccaceae bacterium]
MYFTLTPSRAAMVVRASPFNIAARHCSGRTIYQPGLDGIKSLRIDDRVMSPGVNLALVANASGINRIGKNMMDLSPSQNGPTARVSIPANPQLRS